MNPAISVLMPAFNAGLYISEAIESILGQSFRDFEFIIIDDCSKDNTVEKILSYDDNRIVFIKNNSNMKLAKTLNRGLIIARGKYIARMDADDVAHLTRLEKQFLYLEKNSHISALGTAIQRIDDKGIIGVQNVVCADPFLIRWRMHFSNQITHPTVMVRREAIEHNKLRYGSLPPWFKIKGNYTEINHLSEDYLFFGLLSQKCLISNLEEPLLYFREHAKSVSTENAGEQMETACIVAKLLADGVLNEDLSIDLIKAMYLKKNPELCLLSSHVELLLDRLYESYTNNYREKNLSLDLIRRDYLTRKILFKSRNKLFIFRLLDILKINIIKSDKIEKRMIIENIFHGNLYKNLKNIRKRIIIFLSIIRKKEAKA